MISSLESVKRIYSSTSLLIIKGKVTKVKWIDFTYWSKIIFIFRLIRKIRSRFGLGFRKFEQNHKLIMKLHKKIL
jgi:hypothetical protein